MYGPTQASCPDVREDSVRLRGLVPTTFRLACGTRLEAIVRNVSRCGLGATATGKLPQMGALVVLTLSSGRELQGLVQWLHNRNFGVRFEEPLGADSMQALQALRKSDVGTENWKVSRLHQVDRPAAPGQLIRPV